ncbi:MAG: response regulator transcription factor [Thermotogae bacterium]|nr:response regulator transcription factor [Thermotogota bacterium]
MIKVAIVDDEYPAREELKELIQHLTDFEVVAEYSNIEEMIKNWRDMDILFLDIDLPGIGGMEFAKKSKEVEVVFVTAYDEYAVEAFEVDAVDYLTKPVTKERFLQTVKKIKELFSDLVHLERLPVDCEKGVAFIDIDEVAFLEAFGKKVIAWVGEGEMLVHKWSLKELEFRLPQHFLRVHKSFICNCRKLDRLEKHGTSWVLVVGDRKIPVGRTYLKVVKRNLGL